MVTPSIQKGASGGGRESILLAGRYRTGQRLGQGGHATVYSGVDESDPTRRVAIKVSPATTERRARVEREVVAVEQVGPPWVPEILAHGEEGDLIFVVMEFISGTTLDRIGRRLTLQEVGWLGQDLLAALQAMHVHGVLHRDIKPSNIMVDSSRFRLIDLSSMPRRASAAGHGPQDGGENLTCGLILCSPGYLVPDQLDGIYDERSDCYGAAIVLWEAIANRPLFEKSLAVEVVLANANRVPPPIRDVLGEEGLRALGLAAHPSTVAALDSFFSCALARDSARRFESALATSLAFQQALRVRKANASSTETGRLASRLTQRLQPGQPASVANLPPPLADPFSPATSRLCASRPTQRLEKAEGVPTSILQPGQSAHAPSTSSVSNKHGTAPPAPGAQDGQDPTVHARHDPAEQEATRQRRWSAGAPSAARPPGRLSGISAMAGIVLAALVGGLVTWGTVVGPAAQKADVMPTREVDTSTPPVSHTTSEAAADVTPPDGDAEVNQPEGMAADIGIGAREIGEPAGAADGGSAQPPPATGLSRPRGDFGAKRLKGATAHPGRTGGEAKAQSHPRSRAGGPAPDVPDTTLLGPTLPPAKRGRAWHEY